MELYGIRSILRRYWLTIAVITAASVAVSLFVSWYILEETYQSSITAIVVTPSESDQQDTILTYDEYYLNTQLVNSYKVLCTTNYVLGQVIDALDLDLTAQKLSDMLTISSREGTEFIHIIVESNDPDLSMRIANTVADVFQREVSNLMNRNNVRILDYASAAGQPVSPDRGMNAAIAAVAGLILSLGICFFKDYVNMTVKSLRDIRFQPGVPLLGVVRHLGRRARESADQIAVRLDYINRDRKNTVIAVTSPNRREGKTTVCTLVAEGLAQLGGPVLLIDCNTRFPAVRAAYHMNEYGPGLGDALRGRTEWEACVHPAGIAHLDVMGSGEAPSDAAGGLGSPAMRMLLGALRERYRYILLDMPALAEPGTLALLRGGVRPILVFMHRVTRQSDVAQTYGTLGMLDISPMGIIYNDIPEWELEYCVSDRGDREAE